VRRRVVLLASVAAAALIMAEPAFAEGFYFSASGGANFTGDEDGTFTTRGGTYGVRFDSDTGFLISSAIGLELDRWLHGLKIELEASYRRNSLGGRWTFTSSEVFVTPGNVDAAAVATGPVDGHTSTFALMTNAWYEFEIGSRFKPYFGAGVGWARSQLDGAFESNGLPSALAFNPFTGFSVQNSGFAYQLGAGINSQIMPGVSLGIGYRYFNAPDTEVFFSGKLINSVIAEAPFRNDGSVKFDNVSHSVALTLSIDID
jgi:OOP family OmpA-OmpF porin